MTTKTGTGDVVLSNSPTLVSPILGTPTSGVATNLTGTASGLTAGHVTTNANLTGPITSTGNATSIASQTGTGTKFVMDTSPTLVTPVLGVATVTTINKVTLTAPATGSTLTILDGKTLTANSSLTLAGTDSTTMTFPGISATMAGLGIAQTFSAANIFSATGAASTPGLAVTGAPFTGGSTTTTKPQTLLETTGATSASWGTAGTMLGINAPSGFSGALIDAQNNGTSFFRINSTGTVTATAYNVSTGGTIVWAGRGVLSSPAAGGIKLGNADVAAPIAQTLSVQDVAAGTTNTAGVTTTLIGSLSTGSGTSGDIVLQTGGTGAASTVKNTAVTALTIKGATQAVIIASGKTFQIGNAATTGLTAGVLAATTNATIVITDSTGQAYRIPCII